MDSVVAREFVLFSGSEPGYSTLETYQMNVSKVKKLKAKRNIHLPALGQRLTVLDLDLPSWEHIARTVAGPIQLQMQQKYGLAEAAQVLFAPVMWAGKHPASGGK